MARLRPGPLRIAALIAGFVLCLAATPVRAQTGSEERPTTAVSEAEPQVGYLLSDKVYARPDPSSDLVVSISRDDRVRVTPAEGKNGWFEVYRVGSAERVGFAFRPYVSRFGSAGPAARSASAEPIETTEIRSSAQPSEGAEAALREVVFASMPDEAGVACTVEQWANVRVGPGMAHEAFGVIRPDVPFQVLAIERGWGRVKLAGEQEVGYVSGALLRRVTEPAASPPGPVAVEPSAPLPSKPTVDSRPVQSGTPSPPDASMRSAVRGEAAGGGATMTADESQEAALRNVLKGSGVDAESTVYVTRTGRKFHREGCRHLRSRTFAIPLVEAMLDYSPCRTCRPLQPEDGE